MSQKYRGEMMRAQSDTVVAQESKQWQIQGQFRKQAFIGVVGKVESRLTPRLLYR